MLGYSALLFQDGGRQSLLKTKVTAPPTVPTKQAEELTGEEIRRTQILARYIDAYNGFSIPSTYIVDLNYTHMCFVFHLVFYFSRCAWITVLYSGVIRIFLFNGFSSVFLSCTGVCCSVTLLT